MKQNINVLEYANKIGKEVPDWSTDGILLDVYLVPINKLYYNDENGRIATWISGYNDDQGVKPLEELTIKEYNDLISSYIKKSNSTSSFKKTYDDIKTKGQIRPGVVLIDGRVVSGNRRFTVLRDLYEDTSDDKFNYFKCFIIDKDLNVDESRKQIKTIERLTQFGVDEKQDYDPIDRLVDIYNDLIGPNKIWTIDEYQKKLKLTKSAVYQMYYKALVMVDYLEYINKPGKFHIARYKKLDGPLQELGRLYKDLNRKEWNKIRIYFYSQLQKNGDRTRDIRDSITTYKNKTNEFYDLCSQLEKSIQEEERNHIINESQYSIAENADSQLSSDSQLSPDSEKPIFDLGTTIIDKVLTPETNNQFFDLTFQAIAEKKRADKIKKIGDSLDSLILNIQDAVSIAKEDEKHMLLLKIEEFIRIVAIFSEK